jgi:hypothetical protein
MLQTLYLWKKKSKFWKEKKIKFNKMETRLMNLNRGMSPGNNDADVQNNIQRLLMQEFPGEKLYGAEIGIAFGGGVESLCKIWGDRGFAYGLDTFCGHPKHLSDDVNSFEAVCMDGWYVDYGTDKITYEYIDEGLKSEGLTNYKLIKGEVHEKSLDGVEKLHYVLLDLDMIKPMKIAYEAIKDKMVKGGYICLHDVIPADHLPMIHSWWYGEVMPLGLYQEYTQGKYLGVYKVL